MKKILILILLNISVLFAFEVDIKTDPDMPVKDEAFRLIFEITSEKGGEPIISFDPLGAEVTEKINLGTSTRTTLINGKLSTSRKVSIAYIMQQIMADPLNYFTLTYFNSSFLLQFRTSNIAF